MTKGNGSNLAYVAVATAGVIGMAIATEVYRYSKRKEPSKTPATKTGGKRKIKKEFEERKEKKSDETRLLALFEEVRFNSDLRACHSEEGYQIENFMGAAQFIGDLKDFEPRIMYYCFSFCDLMDLVFAQRVCKSWESFLSAFLQDRQFRLIVAKKGFPKHFHGKCWMMLSGAKLRKKGAYEYLVERASVESLDEKTKHDLSEMSIQRDIPRTLPNHELFRDKAGQNYLYNVLKAYAVHDKVVGYVQGMNFVTAVLTTKFSEEDAFWMLDCLMNAYDARTIFIPELPRLAISLYQFEQLLNLYLPDLAQHFKKIEIRPNMYASEWFMTLFTYTLPLQTVERIWDLFFVDAWLVIHIVGLAILHRAQDDLIKLEFDKCLPYLKKYPNKSVLDVAPLLEDAFSFGVTHEQLDELQKRFISEKHYLNRYL